MLLVGFCFFFAGGCAVVINLHRMNSCSRLHTLQAAGENLFHLAVSCRALAGFYPPLLSKTEVGFLHPSKSFLYYFQTSVSDRKLGPRTMKVRLWYSPEASFEISIILNYRTVGCSLREVASPSYRRLGFGCLAKRVIEGP